MTNISLRYAAITAWTFLEKRQKRSKKEQKGAKRSIFKPLSNNHEKCPLTCRCIMIIKPDHYLPKKNVHEKGAAGHFCPPIFKNVPYIFRIIHGYRNMRANTTFAKLSHMRHRHRATNNSFKNNR